MIQFSAPLWLWSGESASWHFITVPEEHCADIRLHGLAHRGGFGSVKVEVSIHVPSTSSGQAITWRTSVFPQKAGTYLLPVKAEVRRQVDIAAGDHVTVALEII
jgi:hypothetical protein